ncbi:hypothetical protein [Desulfogranum marinum]|uniref:hypothetical protein n=1 Tax=Desulfogranum marinum TaxID=453220 RepID=UPI0019650B4B|nr:hypothetical protein [Desulfogranum marinum]MBM9515233.1 hypothetical protein [Desulfogranum marinum]
MCFKVYINGHLAASFRTSAPLPALGHPEQIAGAMMKTASSTSKLSALSWVKKQFKTIGFQHTHRAEVNCALEAAIDIADSKIRLAPKYKRTALPAIEQAMEYSSKLVAALPGPISLSSRNYHNSPQLRAVFRSPDHIQELLERLPADIKGQLQKNVDIIALLTMSKEIKTTFGHERQGEMILRDAAMQTINFYDHLLVAPSSSLESTQAMLEEKVLEILAATAMETINSLREELTELRERKAHLDSMKRMLKGKKQAFGNLAPPSYETRKKLEETEKLLVETTLAVEEKKKHIGIPEKSLQYLIATFTHPEKAISIEELSLDLNWMNVLKQKKEQSDVNTITLAEFSAGEELKRQGILVTIRQSSL